MGNNVTQLFYKGSSNNLTQNQFDVVTMKILKLDIKTL